MGEQIRAETEGEEDELGERKRGSGWSHLAGPDWAL